MKYLYLILVAALLLTAATASQALFFAPAASTTIANFGPYPVQFHQAFSQTFCLQYGWYEDHVVYFVPWAVSNASLAQQLTGNCCFSVGVDPVTHKKLGSTTNIYYNPFWSVQFAPKLNCAIGKDATNDLYFINGGKDLVFTASPNAKLQEPGHYTPLWRVHLLQSNPAFPPKFYANAADVLADETGGKLVETFTSAPIVLDATIVGDDTGWVIPQSCGLIPQGLLGRYIYFPAYQVFYSSFQWTPAYNILMLDASDPGLAQRFGANYAPRLVNVELLSPPQGQHIDNLDSNKHCPNETFAFTWNPANRIGVPPGQDPVIDEVPMPNCFGVNTNYVYNPIRNWELFNHDVLPPDSMLTTPDAFRIFAKYLDKATPKLYIDLEAPSVTNSPVFPQLMYFTTPG